ncbi:MAG: adenosine deaminase [Acidimicrobiia bacterium]|nr:adenosine deaminase [Acidimicrobiia bacterium]MYC45064.1 adenosine deaminase [Acidimicrobiia bacterium]MYI19436.1 adenosine deaminase [Acidimicrobiia bacterium]
MSISTAATPPGIGAIRSFPKVELHVHLEDCLTSERIEELAAEAGVPMLRPADSLFVYSSLAEFLEVFEWWCDLLRTTRIAEQLAYDAAVQARHDGIVYAELFCGPRYWTRLRREPLIEALAAGFERAHGDGHADLALVPSISREQSAEWAMGLVEWLGASGPARVVGLGLDGNEAMTGRTSPKFTEVYARANELGLGRTAHAGESSGPEGVWDALEHLHVDRVDHGVRSIEDAALLEHLATNGITLNVTPSSNVITGMYPDIDHHPVGPLIEAGVPVTINSDATKGMNLTLSGEFDKVSRSLGWSLADVAAATRRAIDAAFCGQEKAASLHRQVDDHLYGSEGNSPRRDGNS